jgi:ribosomal protein L22
VCPPIAAIVEQAVVAAERQYGQHAGLLVVAGGAVSCGETVVRVRRLAHGKADWISTETTDVRVELRGAE